MKKKKPYLTNYMQEHDLQINVGIYYDNLSQISYTDCNMDQKIIGRKHFEGTVNTRSVENSDPDELYVIGGSGLKEDVEDSDPDEMWLIGVTKQTFTIEDGDPDEYCALGDTRFTKTIEESDPDEMYELGGTRKTATVEDSDPDELAFN
ncbi:MAG: hypothetical protein WCY82_01490 [Desulfotomaculaceae bacterium]